MSEHFLRMRNMRMKRIAQKLFKLSPEEKMEMSLEEIIRHEYHALNSVTQNSMTVGSQNNRVNQSVSPTYGQPDDYDGLENDDTALYENENDDAALYENENDDAALYENENDDAALYENENDDTAPYEIEDDDTAAYENENKDSVPYENEIMNVIPYENRQHHNKLDNQPRRNFSVYRRSAYPAYRRCVQRAVQRLNSRSLEGRRSGFRPYNVRNINNFGRNNVNLGRINNLGRDNNFEVAVENDNYRKNLFVRRPVNKEYTFDLEKPVKNDLTYDYRKFSHFVMYGVRVAVERHTIMNKLNPYVQRYLRSVAEERTEREKLHQDLEDFCPPPHKTEMLMSKRFSFIG